MLRQILVRLLLAIFLIAALGFATIHIQQRLVRIRAERLLADIREIELRKSTWPDAQALMIRWGAFGHYDGTCTSERCEYFIHFGDFFYSHPRLVADSPWFRRKYGRIGGRMSLITADFLVFNGLIWEKGYSLNVAVPPEVGPNAIFGGDGYRLIGSAESRSRLLAGYMPPPSSHPQYEINTPSGCTGCLAVYARFTPHAASWEVNRLFDFNFDCLARWSPCREKAAIMPSVWKQYVAENTARDEARDLIKNCSYPLQWIARDAGNVAIVDVVSNHVEKGEYPFQVSTVRLVERLKAASFWQLGTTRELRVFIGTVSSTPNKAPEDVSPGKRFILMFEHRKEAGPNGPEIWLERCGAAPLTPENRELVAQGVTQDFAAVFR